MSTSSLATIKHGVKALARKLSSSALNNPLTKSVRHNSSAVFEESFSEAKHESNNNIAGLVRRVSTSLLETSAPTEQVSKTFNSSSKIILGMSALEQTNILATKLHAVSQAAELNIFPKVVALQEALDRNKAVVTAVQSAQPVVSTIAQDAIQALQAGTAVTIDGVQYIVDSAGNLIAAGIIGLAAVAYCEGSDDKENANREKDTTDSVEVSPTRCTVATSPIEGALLKDVARLSAFVAYMVGNMQEVVNDGQVEATVNDHTVESGMIGEVPICTLIS